MQDALHTATFPPSRWARAAQTARAELREHRTLLIFFAVYMVVANVVMFAAKGEPIGFPFSAEGTSFYLASRVTVYLGFIATVLALISALRDYLFAKTPLYANALHAAWAPLAPAIQRWPVTLIRIVVFVAMFAVLLSTFMQIKGIIPDLHAYDWDETFAAWDRTLHGGIDPWRISWGLFGGEKATRLIDEIYVSWFLIIHVIPVSILVFDQDRARRNRYLLTYFVLWALLGNIAAVLFASVGPCFAVLMPELSTTLGPAFAPMMDQLAHLNAQQPLEAVKFQAMLWDAYTDPNKLNVGISAMPSLHVAHATLAACFAFTLNRYLGMAAALYAGAIQLGSVHLGWHYAIDGYFAALATVGLWWVMGKVLPSLSENKKAGA